MNGTESHAAPWQTGGGRVACRRNAHRRGRAPDPLARGRLSGLESSACRSVASSRCRPPRHRMKYRAPRERARGSPRRRYRPSLSETRRAAAVAVRPESFAPACETPSRDLRALNGRVVCSSSRTCDRHRGGIRIAPTSRQDELFSHIPMVRFWCKFSPRAIFLTHELPEPPQDCKSSARAIARQRRFDAEREIHQEAAHELRWHWLLLDERFHDDARAQGIHFRVLRAILVSLWEERSAVLDDLEHWDRSTARGARNFVMRQGGEEEGKKLRSWASFVNRFLAFEFDDQGLEHRLRCPTFRRERRERRLDNAFARDRQLNRLLLRPRQARGVDCRPYCCPLQVKLLRGQRRV